MSEVDTTGWKVCHACTYPYPDDACPNPCCFENPRVSDETKQMWRDRTAQRERDAAADEERRRLRAMSFGYRS